ncbi:MAG: succinylglutamate desuccinylase/aspartoacylase family protein [Proteobacteria bacterium]|nr:succinylglutamate desuccinylase/aspartoacylase family protein [Pseudomonadota bacterium]
MDELGVGTARAEPGARGKGKLKIGVLPDGAPLEIPVIIVRGAKPGPTLWLQGCIHGNEQCGTFLIHRFLQSLDPAQLAGAVVALPVLNLTAFQFNRRTSPFEIYQGGDLNRVFPGNPGGTFTEQMAHAIFTELSRVATHMVDFHTAHLKETRWALFTNLEGEVGKKAETMARAWGYVATFPAPRTKLTTAAYMQAAIQKGIPGLIVECGGKGPAFDDEAVADGAERLRNVARSIGLIDGPVTRHNGVHFVSDFAWVRSRRGGLFRNSVMPGDRIAKGDEIGRIYDIFGALREKVRAPHGGIVLTISPGPTLVSGDTLIHIGLEPRPA